jgi:hypothetical protein
VKIKNHDDQYTDEEAQLRFEAALRGAREIGHEPMKNFQRKLAGTKPKEKKVKASDRT